MTRPRLHRGVAGQVACRTPAAALPVPDWLAADVAAARTERDPLGPPVRTTCATDGCHNPVAVDVGNFRMWRKRRCDACRARRRAAQPVPGVYRADQFEDDGA